MSNPTLTLVRGLPGSGKSTYAKKAMEIKYGKTPTKWDKKHVLYEADQFFIADNGQYNYDQPFIAIAHDWCFSSTVKALKDGYDVWVANTFCNFQEMERYLGLGEIIPNLNIEVYVCKNKFKSIHNVPDGVIEKMKARWQNFNDEIVIK